MVDAPPRDVPARHTAPEQTAAYPASTRGPSGTGPDLRRYDVVLWGIAAVIVASLVMIGILSLGGSSDDSTVAGGTGQPVDGGSSPVDDAPAPPDESPSPQPDETVEEEVVVEPLPSPAAAGDLGLGVPISPPACDGSWVVFVGNSTDPALYRTEVPAFLSSRPGSKYLLTEGGCSSMRQRMPDGNQIYAVYIGPYPTQADACAARAQAGGDAYVKRMDNSTPAAQLWQC